MSARALATTLAAGAAALAAAGCGEPREAGGRAPSTTPTPVATRATTVGEAVATVGVSLSEYRLDPGNARVARPGVIAFVATNDGQRTHALEVDGPAGSTSTVSLRPGEQSRIAVRLVPGTYRWLCPIGDHERRGMVGRVRVAE